MSLETRKFLINWPFNFDEEERFGEDLWQNYSKSWEYRQADFDAGNNTMSFNKQLAFGGEGKDKLDDKPIPSFLKSMARMDC